MECIWNRVQISLSVADNHMDVSSTVSVSVTGVYVYEGATWSGSYTLNDALTKSVIGKYGYTVSSITDSNYGLTIFE